MSLVDLTGVAFTYGGPNLLDGVNCAIEPSDRAGLLGRNGAGKSTLLRLIAGELEPTAGVIARKNGLRVAELSQRLPADVAGAARDVVALGFGAAGERLARYHRLVHDLSAAATREQLAEIDRLHDQIERDGGFSREPEIERALTLVGIDPDADWTALSVGKKRRVLLARALASEPDLLILDEPTNHLDIEAIEWLEDFLVRYRGTLLFVTHDRAFLRRVATRVLLVDRGRVVAYDCGYDVFVGRREADEEAAARQEELQDRLLAKEEAWAKQGVKARRTRAEARVRALERLREERRARKTAVGRAQVEVTEAERSGDLVAELKDVSFCYPGCDEPVLEGVSTLVTRGDKIGVIGPNGSGKTTLLRILLGELEPTAGAVRRGTRLEVAYFDQLHAALDEAKTVAGNLTEGDFVVVGERRRHVVGFLADFLFRPEQVRGSVRDLSGGERNRLLLARMFTRPTNVLVLDEPTNDLDAETVEVLEELLVDYRGTILLVSHDREFLNRVATSTLVLEGGGRVGEYAGGYDDWLLQRKAAPAAAARKGTAAPARKAGAAPLPPGPRKRSFREAQEAAALPGAIEALEGEREALHAQLGDPAIYARDPAAVARATARLAAIAAALERSYARWEELEALG